MSEIEVIGCFSAFLTTISFLPQTIKTLLKKETKGISALMYIAFTIGIIGWITYGILVKDRIIISANIVTLVFSVIILAIKLRNVWLKKEDF